MPEAMYRQIAGDLRGKIETGELPPGSRLPTELELMERYNTSRNTVRDSIRLLITRDLVETRPGQGTFVRKKFSPFVTTLTSDPHAGDDADVYTADIRKNGREPRASNVRVEIGLADPVIADALRIGEGEQVVSRHQQRFIDGTPWSLQTTFYPMRLVVEHGAWRLIQAADLAEGTVSYLARECGIKQAGYRDSISARPPEEHEAAFFRLPADGRVPVFVIFRVGFDQDGARFRVTITVYPVDRNRFLVKVGDVPSREATVRQQD